MMIDSNTFLIDFVNNNWMGLVMLYSIVRSIFPNNKVLKAIGEAFSARFPVFGGNQ
jgi:hypothetical protein